MNVSENSPSGARGKLLPSASDNASKNLGSAARWQSVLKRTAIVLLLLAVPILSTLAKQSWYLPQANTAHYLNGAIKMKVSHAPLLVHWQPSVTIVKFVPPAPPETFRHKRSIDPPVPDLGVTLSLQHRSPPSSL